MLPYLDEALRYFSDDAAELQNLRAIKTAAIAMMDDTIPMSAHGKALVADAILCAHTVAQVEDMRRLFRKDDNQE